MDLRVEATLLKLLYKLCKVAGLCYDTIVLSLSQCRRRWAASMDV